MRTVMILFRAAHAPPTVAVTALGTAVAVSAGRGAWGCVLVAATLLTGQLSIGWSNDAIDADRDVAAGRTDKPIAAGQIARRPVAVAAVIAVLACIPLSFANGFRAGCASLVVVVGGWAYNVGLKRTAASWVPYAVAFGALPAFIALGLPGSPWPRPWVILAGALLGVGAHFLNVVPDMADDLEAGIRGLPHRMGERASRATGAVLLTGAAAAVTFGPPGHVPPWAYAGLLTAVVLSAAAALLGQRQASKLPFLLALLTAVVAVALLVGRGSSIS